MNDQSIIQEIDSIILQLERLKIRVASPDIFTQSGRFTVRTLPPHFREGGNKKTKRRKNLL